MKIQIGNTMGYYTAELEEPTLTIGMDYFGSDWFPAIDVWCEESFGPEDRWGVAPISGWKRMRCTYCFVDEAKLNWFVTRWS